MGEGPEWSHGFAGADPTELWILFFSDGKILPDSRPEGLRPFGMIEYRRGNCPVRFALPALRLNL